MLWWYGGMVIWSLIWVEKWDFITVMVIWWYGFTISGFQKNAEKKKQRLAEIDQKINDLDNHKKVFDRAKKGGNAADKELEH